MKNSESRQASSEFEQTSFLPEPDFNPTYPTLNTNPARCLAFMLNGESFTHPEFYAVVGGWRLAAVVYDLKALGWPVESIDIPAATPEHPGRTISRYYLPPKVIKSVFGGGRYDRD
jgi:hypothetical protein